MFSYWQWIFEQYKSTLKKIINRQQKSKMRNSPKKLNGRPSEEESSLRSPLIAPSSGNRHDPARQIDVVRLVNNQEESRVTTVNLNAYRPYQRTKKQPRMSGVLSANLRSDQEEDHQEHVLPSDGASDFRKMARLSRLSEHQSFIGTYQNNHVIGTIMYLLFLLFISVEILAAAYIAPKPQDSQHFYLQKTLIIILAAQFLCYLLMRYLNAKTDTKFIKKSTISGSLKKVFATHSHHSLPASSRTKSPYLYIVILVVCLVLGQVAYCTLLSSSSSFLDTSRRGYMISSIFWSNLALPFLFQNFYISEISYHSNFKLKLFPYLVIFFMLYCFVESYLFFLLAAFKLIHIYTHTRQGYDMFHIDYLLKAVTLVVVLICSVIKFQVLDIGSLFTAHLLTTVLHTLIKIAIVSGAMLATRVVALHFLKLELYKYFYTEMHIQLGFIIATMIMYVGYIDFVDFQLTFGLVQILIALGFLTGIGVLVYLQGKEKMEVKMDAINEEH